MKSNRIRLLHIITGLQLGGAEMTLWRLMSRLDRSKFALEVVSLSRDGIMSSLLRDIGIVPRTLNMRSGVPDPRAFLRLRKWVKELRPDIIQTWLYHSDLLGGLAGAMLGVPVIWNLRQSDLSWHGNKSTTLLTAMSCAALSSRIPARIVCCSNAARRAHERLGYAADKLVVIPNGFDMQRFKPDAAARQKIRRELGLPEGTPLIGLIARFHVQKDHRNFFEACRRIVKPKNVHFLLCGHEIDWHNRELTAMIAEAGVADRCHLLGVRLDIQDIMAALDVVVSSSSGEGFPNVVGEAMACAVPCVATDVGDCSIIVGETGRVIPARRPAALAAAVSELLGMHPDARKRLGLAARRRIATKFDLALITDSYERLYQQAAASSLVVEPLPAESMHAYADFSTPIDWRSSQHDPIGMVRYLPSGMGGSQTFKGKEVDNEFVGTSS